MHTDALCDLIGRQAESRSFRSHVSTQLITPFHTDSVCSIYTKSLFEDNSFL